MDLNVSKKYEECIICLEDLKNNIVVLNCNHRYHYVCIQSWFLKKNTLKCPLCRCDSEIVNILDNIVETSNISPHISTNIKDTKEIETMKNINSFDTDCCIIM